MANREIEALRRTVQAAKKIVARPPLDQADNEPAQLPRVSNVSAKSD